jgi:hypothetical protein
MRVLVGTHTYDAAGDAGRRQAAAIASLRQLKDAALVNVQFADGAHDADGLETRAVLARDARTVTRRAGPRKAIVSDILDALCDEAEARGARVFCYANADILIAQDAIDVMASGAHEALLFSREDFDGQSGASLGMCTSGTDAIALSPAWWRANRFRFRPYIAGEAVWDNVYTAIVMCHAEARLENRRPLVRHEAHGAAWTPGAGPYAHYTQYLAALDSGYFALWCRYWAGLQDLRRRGAPERDEAALARDVFVWRPGPAARLVQQLRTVKAAMRYQFRLPPSPPAP